MTTSATPPQIMLDFDSTVFCLLDAMRLCTNGERVSYADCPTWAGLIELCGPEGDHLTTKDRLHIMLDVFSEAMTFEHMSSLGEKAIFAGADRALQRMHAAGVKIHVLTDRPDDRMEGTARFLNEYNIPFDSIHRVSGRDKAAWCVENGVHVMIDDHPETIEQAHAAGLTVLSLAQLYNAEVAAELGLELAGSWDELEGQIEVALAARYGAQV
jgi:phosphoglycolate phosphatase-like HAD superfamily hydrolase